MITAISFTQMIDYSQYHLEAIIHIQSIRLYILNKNYLSVGPLLLVSDHYSILAQGPLNIWTEHSNYQIHSMGDSKTLIALLIPNIFLIFFMKLFFYAYKSWGMTQCDIFHVFVENSVNSELCFFWALLKPVKIWNLSKNAHVWAA